MSETPTSAKETLLSLRSKLKSLTSSTPLSPTALHSPSLSPSNIPLNFTIRHRRTLRGHFGKVYSLQWSSCSSYLLSAAQDGKLLVWNAHTGNKINAILLRSNWVMTCAFSPSSGLVACGGLDNCVSVFKNDSFKGFDISCSDYKKDKNLNLVNGMEAINEEGKGRNGGNSYLGKNSNPLAKNNYNSNRSNRALAELNKHSGYVSCVRFVDEGSVVSASGDSSLVLWDLEKKACVSSFKSHSGDVMSLSLFDYAGGNGNKLFVTGSCDTTCKLFDLRENHAVISFNHHKADVNSVFAFNHSLDDSKSFEDGKKTKNKSKNKNSKNCSENSENLNIGNLGNLGDGVKIENLNFEFGLNGMGSNLSGFLSGSDDGTVGWWDLRSASLVGQFDCDDEGVVGVSASKSGRIIFAATDSKNVKVWDGLKGEKMEDLVGHEGKVSCVEVSGSGGGVASGSWDKMIKIWS